MLIYFWKWEEFLWGLWIFKRDHLIANIVLSSVFSVLVMALIAHCIVIISFSWFYLEKYFAGDTCSESSSTKSTIYGLIGTIRLVVGRYP